jgi:hypothetical protein
MANLHVGDYGTHFIATVKDPAGIVIDVSESTNITFTYKKHDKTTIEKTGTFNTDGKDGKVLYVTQAGDIDQAGTWNVQVTLLFPDGGWSSSIASFTVEKNL